MADADFIHRFIAPGMPESPILILLHGTGGNEQDLIPLGRELMPGAGILSIRGKVLENGMPRFFRRLAEGVFDQEDLKFRTEELAAFLEFARKQHGLADNEFIAVGYSNGANIAASLLLSGFKSLQAAVLLRAMIPFQPEGLPDLRGIPIFMGEGERDPIVPRANAEELAEIFRQAGAGVVVHWHKGGHGLGEDDVDAARLWLAQGRQ
jgi:predicted esterase